MPQGANRNTKRRGRGSGSGHGKTSCRGRKGAKKRSGRTTRPGFEGGQMPLVRRIPKRGFNARFHKDYQVVNVESLNRFTANAVIGLKEMKDAGLITSVHGIVKILGDGTISKVVTVKAHKISESAMKKLTESGSKFESLIVEKAPEKVEAKARPKTAPKAAEKAAAPKVAEKPAPKTAENPPDTGEKA